METIGFIGVGLMGHGMAKNIMEGGYAMHVLANRNREPVDDLVAKGAKEASSVAEIASKCDVVFLCLPGSPEVEAVIDGPDGLIANRGDGLAIVDCSTSNPVSTKALVEKARASGVVLIDAPLAKTPKEAEAGTLDTMVGADPDDFERLKPIIECWAGRIIHVGEPGAGHVMKLLNNFLAMGYAALYSEALAVGKLSGVTPEVFDSVIGGGRMDNGFYQTFMQYVLKRDRNAHRFSMKNAHKDMRYLAELANSAGAVNMMGSAIKNSYAVAEAAGRGEDYVPQLSDVIAELNGTSLTD